MNAGDRARWVRWKEDRYQELSEAGLQAHLAHRIATIEAGTRQRLAQVIGEKCALDAQLTCQFEGDTVRFALAGPIDSLTEVQAANIRAMSGTARK